MGKGERKGWCATMFKIITTIIIILAVLMVCIAAFKTDNIKKKEVYYECKDMFGNNVVCEKIYNSYGQLWGITSDGTAVQITSGRKVGD